MEKVGITVFRKSLKSYLEQTASSGDQIYQIGSEAEALLLSPATLEHLQQRHFVNRWIRGRYVSLKLDQYPTLAKGSQTKELSLEHLLALGNLFSLGAEVLDTLAHTGAKQNAMRWDISEYMKAFREKRPLLKHGRFDTVYTLFRTLLEPWTIDLFRERKTLYEFFQFLRDITDMDKACRHKGEYTPKHCLWEDGSGTEVTYLKDFGASTEQMDYLAKGIDAFCALFLELLSFQVSPEPGQSPDYPLLLCNPLFAWYEEGIAPLPKSFGYDPVWGI